ICAVFTVPILVLAWAPLKHSHTLYGGLQVGFATLIQILATPLYSHSIRSIIFLHIVDMNVLAVVSTSIAYVFSIVAYASEVAGNPFSSPFFETSALLFTLIFMGRTVQAATRKSAGSAIRALHRLQDKEVTILEDGISKIIDSRLLHYGDIIQVNPGSRIVTDGVIISGMSDVDESSITGESAAVSKITGNLVIAGTINLTGTLRIQVTRLLHENSLSKITKLIKSAQSSRAPLQDLADRFSAIVLPVAFTAACVAFLVWILVDIFVRKQGRTDAGVDGLMKAIAVLVVSCPCAVGLAVPMVIAVSMLILSRNGILVRSADVLHLGKRVTVVAFDKTGTLSQGKFTVEKSDVFIAGSERVVYELVKNDNHPIAQGVCRYLKDQISLNDEKEVFEFGEFEVLAGKGMRAVMDGFEVLGGKPAYTGSASNTVVATYISSGLSLFTVTVAGTCLAVYGLADLPRPESPTLIKTLHKTGKKTVILSGDNEAAVSQFAARVGVDVSDAHFSCTPEDKQAFIAAMRANHEVVLFVGDGTNDGPALATADASLAIASGSEVASTSAGAVLLHSDINRGIMLLFNVAKAADLRMKISLVWCAVYMVAAIVLASGAAVDFSIEARWAGLGEVISVLPVVLIGFSMQLQ
ncbi:E1-E2 ATPase-domain-containing protein, partial [Cyathus striatus]